MRFQSFLASFHIGAATGWDIFIILIALIAIFIYGFLLGRNRIVLVLLSSYFSLIIMKFLPWARLSELKWLGIGETPASSLQIIIFLALILFFYMFLPRSILSSVARIRKRGDTSWIHTSILATLQIGLLVSIVFSFLPEEASAKVMPLVKKIFLGSGAQFIWVVLPLLAVFLLKKPKKHED